MELKIGSTFEENGITYKVIGKNDSGFISEVYVPKKSEPKKEEK